MRIDRTLHALALCALMTLPVAAMAQQPLNWTAGPGPAAMGDGLAEIDLGYDYVFLDAPETRRLMEFSGNPISGQEVGTLSSASEDDQWFVVFEWDAMGYVDDSERDELDSVAMLASIREGNEAANAERRRRGWTTIDVVGWHEEPHYDSMTNNLTWALVGESQGERNINRIIKILGRHGVMTATLVCSQEDLAVASAAVDRMLAGYRFQPGNTYAEYVPGSDKLAEYGLTALVVGGAGAAIVKSGLLVRFWKVLVAGVLGLGAALKKMLGFGRRDEPTYS